MNSLSWGYIYYPRIVDGRLCYHKNPIPHLYLWMTVYVARGITEMRGYDLGALAFNGSRLHGEMVPVDWVLSGLLEYMDTLTPGSKNKPSLVLRHGETFFHIQ